MTAMSSKRQDANQACTCPDVGPDNWKTAHDTGCPVVAEKRAARLAHAEQNLATAEQRVLECQRELHGAEERRDVFAAHLDKLRRRYL